MTQVLTLTTHSHTHSYTHSHTLAYTRACSLDEKQSFAQLEIVLNIKLFAITKHFRAHTATRTETVGWEWDFDLNMLGGAGRSGSRWEGEAVAETISNGTTHEPGSDIQRNSQLLPLVGAVRRWKKPQQQ